MYSLSNHHRFFDDFIGTRIIRLRLEAKYGDDPLEILILCRIFPSSFLVFFCNNAWYNFLTLLGPLSTKWSETR